MVEWSTADVENWLITVGFGQYAHCFGRKHKIDGELLLSITENDLRCPPLQLSVLGDIKRMHALIDELRMHDICGGKHLGAHERPAAESPCSCHHRRQTSPAARGLRGDAIHRYCVMAAESVVEGPADSSRESRAALCQWDKVVLTSFYVILAFCVSAVSMTIVHVRVPDMDMYRPLPDIILDNVPRIPWAFKLTEVIGLLMLSVFTLVLILHKQRVLILCRFNVLTGSIFFLRCLTLVVTSLSVPGRHLECRPLVYRTPEDVLRRALTVALGFGMSLTGVNTCGDYMFSGHTAALTLLNFFISEYTPRRFQSLHIAMWLCNSFGVFFILAAHEHYTIDVTIAFLITSRMFLYYHALANSTALGGSDRERFRQWFPLFTYVEDGRMSGIVQNEYEVPLVKSLQSYLSSAHGWWRTRMQSQDELQGGCGRKRQ